MSGERGTYPQLLRGHVWRKQVLRLKQRIQLVLYFGVLHIQVTQGYCYVNNVTRLVSVIFFCKIDWGDFGKGTNAADVSVITVEDGVDWGISLEPSCGVRQLMGRRLCSTL